MSFGILSALLDEQRALLAQLQEPQRHERGGRVYWRGALSGHDVVLATSGIGKVAAAATTTTLVEAFGVNRLVFTGVAGGIASEVQVGDVVVGTGFVQHDMDCSPLFARYELPGYGQSVLAADPLLSGLLLQACHAVQLNTHQGLIASGDRFVSRAGEAAELFQALAQVALLPYAVEMECAAVAQVCKDYAIPFAAVRTISDRADAQAHGDFAYFVKHVASHTSHAILSRLLNLL